MPSAVLILSVVALPLVLVGCFCTAFYKLRRYRTSQPDDIERVRNIDHTRHANDNAIPLRDLERRRKPIKISLPYDPRTIVTTALAPIAKPIASPNVDVKGTGGGFVQYYGTSNGGFSHDSQPATNTEHNENANIYGGEPWEYKRGKLEQPGLYHDRPRKSLEIRAPQPVYTSTNYGRWNTSVDPAMTMYGIDTKASETWKKIEKREPLTRSSREACDMGGPMSPSAATAAEEFENVELGGDEVCRRQGHQENASKAHLSRQEQVAQRMAEARVRMEERERQEEERLREHANLMHDSVDDGHSLMKDQAMSSPGHGDIVSSEQAVGNDGSGCAYQEPPRTLSPTRSMVESNHSDTGSTTGSRRTSSPSNFTSLDSTLQNVELNDAPSEAEIQRQSYESSRNSNLPFKNILSSQHASNDSTATPRSVHTDAWRTSQDSHKSVTNTSQPTTPTSSHSLSRKESQRSATFDHTPLRHTSVRSLTSETTLSRHSSLNSHTSTTSTPAPHPSSHNSSTTPSRKSSLSSRFNPFRRRSESPAQSDEMRRSSLDSVDGMRRVSLENARVERGRERGSVEVVRAFEDEVPVGEGAREDRMDGILHGGTGGGYEGLSRKQGVSLVGYGSDSD